MPQSELRIKGLESLISAFHKDLPIVRIGILGSKHRKQSVQTNAEVGAKHEFGSDGLPIRSFLRMPLTDHLRKYLDKNNAFDRDVLAKVIAEKSLISWMKKVAIVAEEVVQEAFSSGGFGHWAPSDMTHKKVHLTLVETAQLRNSIQSKVL